MKKVIFVLALMLTLGLQAQNRPNQDRKGRNFDKEMADLTPQQRAELKTQKMTLHLDLTEAQQQKVQKLHEAKEIQWEEMRLTDEQRQSMTQEERYAHKKARTDKQIEFKRELKEILTEEQYSKFENTRQQCDGKRKSKGGPRS